MKWIVSIVCFNNYSPTTETGAVSSTMNMSCGALSGPKITKSALQNKKNTFLLFFTLSVGDKDARTVQKLDELYIKFHQD